MNMDMNMDMYMYIDKDEEIKKIIKDIGFEHTSLVTKLKNYMFINTPDQLTIGGFVRIISLVNNTDVLELPKIVMDVIYSKKEKLTFISYKNIKGNKIYSFIFEQHLVFQKLSKDDMFLYHVLKQINKTK